MKHYDLIVIGAGSGLDVAVEAAQQGLKTAIIEEGPLGGTCLNRGCIPSKMVLHAADVAEDVRNSDQFGLSAMLKKINFKKVIERATELVDSEARGIKEGVYSTHNPVLYNVRARFVGKRTLQVGKEVITGDKIVIAAGTRPFIPPIEGLDRVPYLTSTQALRLRELPKSMIIIGGGYIAAELGYFYASMGCQITIIQRNKVLLPNIDHEVAEKFTSLWKEKWNVVLNANVEQVEYIGKKILVSVKIKGKTTILKAEKLLVAAGRISNADVLQVGKSGIKTDKKGYIIVDNFMETNVSNIWALGDIAGKFQFKHSANLEAGYVLQNMLGHKKMVDYYPMPYAIFTNPQIAGVGMSEQEAILGKKEYVVGRYEYKDTGMGAAMGITEGFVKFIVDKKTHEILGCHILGPQASVLIHEVVVAMKANRSRALEILQSTVHVHPALSEVVQRAALSVKVR